MLRHNWPGNIRELRNVMERIFVISRDNQLIFTPTPTAAYDEQDLMTQDYAMFEGGGDLKSFSNAAERWLIEKTLRECNGCVGEAAERLGIHRSVFYRKLHPKPCGKEHAHAVRQENL